MKKRKNLCLYAIAGCLMMTLMVSCESSKRLSYFNNIGKDTTIKMGKASIDSVIRTGDILQITVTSLDEQATRLFLETSGLLSTGASGNSGLLSGILVDESGIINFPLIGAIKTAGQTKKQLASVISSQIIAKKIMIDPVISIRIVNYRVTVLGEVNRPGIIPVPNESITLPEALAQAGDLTAFGRRDNLLLEREVNGERVIKRFSLNDSQLFEKEYYYLQNHDIIYVEPTKAKATLSDRNIQLLPLVTGTISLLVVIFATLFKH